MDAAVDEAILATSESVVYSDAGWDWEPGFRHLGLSAAYAPCACDGWRL